MFLAFSVNYQKFTQTIDNDPLFIFLNFAVIIFMYILVIHTIYLLLFQRYTFASHKISIRLRIILNLILTIASLYIILIRNFDKVNLIIFVISEVPFVLIIESYLETKSIEKVLNKNNIISTIIYLIKEHNQKDINDTLYLIINNHQCDCDDIKCEFCNKIKQLKKTDDGSKITVETVCVLLFEAFIQDTVRERKIYLFDDIVSYLSYYHIIDLYITSLTHKKNLIKIILKCNKIKTLIKTTKRTNNLTTKVTSYFSFNFFLNIDLLYNDIATELIQADTQKVAYLISIDIYKQEIKKFIKKIFTFFQLNINNPLEVNLLAKEFSVLLKKVDFDFLVTKENKYNYHCIIVGFILEELYNDRLNQNVFLSESIHSCDEIIEAKIKNEKSMLVL